MKNISEILQQQIVIFDGAMGTELYQQGFFVNTSYEALCLSRPDVIQAIHQSYRDAGAEVLTTNSYAANRKKLMQFGQGDQFEKINTAAVKLAREVCTDDMMVAASVGPAGNLADADEIISEHAAVLAAAAPDFILFETLSSCNDLAHAIYAADRLPADMPFIFSFALDDEACTSHGEPAAQLLKMVAESTRKPVALGLNCCSGAGDMLRALEVFIPLSPYPVIAQPNAGQPKNVDNRMLYMCSPEYFTTYALRYLQLGARGLGGCCGTTPAHIKDMARSAKPMSKTHVVTAAPVTAEVPLQEPVPSSEKSSFAAKLSAGEWVHTIEMVPPQGYLLDKTLEKCMQCKDGGFDAINIPDGPRASSRISAMVAAYKIQEVTGMETILHCCCRDRNVIGIQAELLGCAALGIRNVLFITGDPPKLGDYPFATGVFDLDSIGAVGIQSRLNRGVDFGGKTIGEKTKTFILVGADPNAIDFQRELRRTREKIDAGAEVVVTQPVFDVDALLRFMDAVPELASGKVHVIAGIWPLVSYRNALFMKNEVPGVTVPDSVMERMAQPQTKEAQLDAGIAIAREAVARIRHTVSGVQISAPFGKVDAAVRVMDKK